MFPDLCEVYAESRDGAEAAAHRGGLRGDDPERGEAAEVLMPFVQEPTLRCKVSVKCEKAHQDRNSCTDGRTCMTMKQAGLLHFSQSKIQALPKVFSVLSSITFWRDEQHK